MDATFRLQHGFADRLIAPALANRVRVIGRTASLQRQAQHVRLDGNAYFSQRYVDAMMFDA